MCIFCDVINDKGNIILQEKSKLVSCFFDGFPLTKYHMLFIPNRHTHNYFELYFDEKCHIDSLLMKWSKKLQQKDNSITGFNIFWNNGYSAGQTINHAHCHIVPRRDGDIENPVGGCRNIFPDKADYTK